MRELAPVARGSQDAGTRNLVFTFWPSTVLKACEFCAKRETAKSYFSSTVGTSERGTDRRKGYFGVDFQHTRKKLANMISNLNHATHVKAGISVYQYICLWRMACCVICVAMKISRGKCHESLPCPTEIRVPFSKVKHE